MSKKRKFDAESSTLTNNKKSHWSLGLLDAMKDPALLVKSDDKIVIIKDKYPKAKFHYLVLPKDEISNLAALSGKHVELLQYMEAAAEALIENEVNNKNIRFKFGYHAEASMHRLHMHLISDDMCSDCLKTKRHWNSFTTDFFINSHVIREDLEKNGRITILPSAKKIKDFLNKPLACHKCEETPKNIPVLKKHILTHVKI